MQILNFTPKELAFAERQFICRTKYEIKAYYLLPKSMRGAVERNPLIKIDGHNDLFFPDLLLRKDKIIIEIDGKYHNSFKQKKHDHYRDDLFTKHGYSIIRIKNEDLYFPIVYWQRLLEGLEKNNFSGPSYISYISELMNLIEIEKKETLMTDWY